MKILIAAGLALVLSATVGAADDVKAGDLTVDSPWARATPKGSQVGAGYLTIKNDGATADRLTGVAADFAAVQVHEMKANNGVMQMREITGGLEIPAHGVVKLQPSGYHLMFVGLKHPLMRGDTVKLTLTFEHAGAVAVDFPVLPVGAPGPGATAPGATAHEMKGMKM